MLFSHDKTELIQYPIAKTAGTYAIPGSVTRIGDLAFANAANLVSITIPNSLTDIGSGAFQNSPRLTSINVADNNSNYTQTNGVLFNINRTTLVAYPSGSLRSSYTIPTSGVVFGDNMFYGASSLKLVRALSNAPDCTFCSDELFSGAPATLCRYPSASGWPAMNALYFGIPQADLSTSACAKSESTSSGISTGSTTKTPTGSMTARTRCAASGLCTTTGTVPAGTDHVTQTATSSKSQIVKTTCTISKKTSYVCKLRLGPGSWRLTTQARSGSKRGPKAITHAKLKTKRPTAVTG